MRVLKGLVARTCLPIFVIYILKCDSDQIEESDIVFLLCLAIFTSILTLDLFDASFYCFTMLQKLYGFLYVGAYFMIIYLIQFERNINRQRIKIDTTFPGINFRGIFTWLNYEINCLLSFLFKYIKIKAIQPLKILGLIVYLGGHAVVFLFVIETVFNVCVTLIYFSLFENFVYTFDVNTAMPYPEGYLNPKLIETHLYDKPSIQKEEFNETDEKCKRSYTSYHSLDNKYPFQYKLIYRYLGEDVKFPCEYKVTGYYKERPHMTMWYSNNNTYIVRNDSRHSIFHSIELTTNKGEYSVSSYLQVKLLQESDFGEHICTTILVEKSAPVILGSISEKYNVSKYTLFAYKLVQLCHTTKIIYGIVGNLLASENFFFYHIHDDADDVILQYTINDRSVGQICQGYHTHICSTGTFLLRMLMSAGKIEEVMDFPYLDTGVINVKYIKRGIFYFCLCSYGFGTHRISFLRSIEQKNNTYRNEEIQHPFVYIVLPASELSIFRFFDDSHLYKEVEDLVLNGAHLDLIESRVNDIVMFIAANEAKVLGIANVLQAVLFILTMVLILVITKVTTSVYFRYFIYFPVVFTCVYKPELPEPELRHILPIDDKTTDIFLSYSDSEYDFVSETLLPFLENTCNYRVSFADRDFHQGKTVFSSYVESIKNSRKIIVIISKSFMEEPHCIHFQLEHIILPMLYEESIQPHGVLFLKYDNHCRLPKPLRWNFEVDTFSWTNDLPLNVKLNKLRKWFLSGEI